MALKWSRKWSQNVPGRGIRQTQIQKNEFCVFGSPQNSKMDPQNDPKVIKHKFGNLSCQAKKTWLPVCCFFSRFLRPPRSPRPSKSSQNAIKVCKNEGATFHEQNKLQNVSKNDPPPGTPKGSKKLNKHGTRNLQKRSWKKHKKNTET